MSLHLHALETLQNGLPACTEQSGVVDSESSLQTASRLVGAVSVLLEGVVPDTQWANGEWKYFKIDGGHTNGGDTIERMYTSEDVTSSASKPPLFWHESTALYTATGDSAVLSFRQNSLNLGIADFQKDEEPTFYDPIQTTIQSGRYELRLAHGSDIAVAAYDFMFPSWRYWAVKDGALQDGDAQLVDIAGLNPEQQSGMDTLTRRFEAKLGELAAKSV